MIIHDKNTQCCCCSNFCPNGSPVDQNHVKRKCLRKQVLYFSETCWSLLIDTAWTIQMLHIWKNNHRLSLSQKTTCSKRISSLEFYSSKMLEGLVVLCGFFLGM
eukprot:GHVL01038321.1.p1 GENE.GHVL01038321.1~~GHVL01038321.1.p1  ORF type:complete len:104 (+),score=1.94 GHVL01038321.1:1265-1576(+)